MSNRTLTIIKPEIIEAGLSGKVLHDIRENGFNLKAMKMLKLSEEQAGRFYAVHNEKDFYPGLIRYMTSGPVIVAVLEKDNAVKSYRTYIGTTDPMHAAENTLRKKYGTNTVRNAVHASDSNENAAIEISFFFSETEIF